MTTMSEVDVAQTQSPYRRGTQGSQLAQDRDDEGGPDTGARTELDLLVWDAPNIDMTLANVIGARPSPTSRAPSTCSSGTHPTST